MNNFVFLGIFCLLAYAVDTKPYEDKVCATILFGLEEAKFFKP